MSRKKGPDIRNGHWLYCDDQLLSTSTGTVPATASNLRIVSPGELANIVAESDDIILTALSALEEKARATSPDPDKYAEHAWLFTAKMAPAGSYMARGTALLEASFDRDFGEVAFSDPKDFKPDSREYLERMISMGHHAQLLLGLKGWSAVRDGGWLQIRP